MRAFMLNIQQLADQKEIDDFINGKTDREIAISGLTLVSAHTKECAERWGMVVTFAKWIVSLIGFLVAIELAKLVHVDPVMLINALHG